MEVQSLSCVVPVKGKCLNNCPFCVSHINALNNKFLAGYECSPFYWEDYKKRMAFARDNQCNTLMITSTRESIQNIKFIRKVLDTNHQLVKPFRWIEMQTSGVGLIKRIIHPDASDRDLLRDIDTFAISVADIFNSNSNASIMNMPENQAVDLDLLCRMIKSAGKNLRICINLTKIYDDVDIKDIFKRLHELDADQVTFRKLYYTDGYDTENEWIDLNHISDTRFDNYQQLIKTLARPLEPLPFGAMKYSFEGISTVVDSDCMSQLINQVMKYLILRENAKLYSKWDDEGSLIF